MKERPILFSGPMVRAILDGRKSVTRRVAKLPHDHVLYSNPDFDASGADAAWQFMGYRDGEREVDSVRLRCPYGKPGDRLWVRESLEQEYTTADADTPNGCLATYRADSQVVYRNGRPAMYEWQRPTLPSIHMPRWASRITLEVTEVRVERLQDISQDDAEMEGIDTIDSMTCSGDVTQFYTVGDICEPCPRQAFAELWDSINAKTYPWESNPWVWAIEFARVDEVAQ